MDNIFVLFHRLPGCLCAAQIFGLCVFCGVSNGRMLLYVKRAVLAQGGCALTDNTQAGLKATQSTVDVSCHAPTDIHR